MKTTNKDHLSSIDFSELFKEGQDHLSIERVQAFLDKSINAAAKSSNTSPNHLVRVVHGRKVLWMTQEQANKLLAEPNTNGDTLKHNVEQALRGNIHYLRQELEILLALAYYTYQQYSTFKAVSKNSLEHIPSNLERRKQGIHEGVSETTEAEQILEQKRAQNPLLDEYEAIMADFLNVKSKGDLEKAKILAKQLNEKKQKYVLLTRALEPDVRTIYYHRLNLQKTKKRILSTQNELLASRMDDLIFKIKEMKKNLEEIQEGMKEREEQSADSITLSVDELDETQSSKNTKHDLHQMKKNLIDKSSELRAVNQESSLVKRHEDQVDKVIQHVSENVLQEQEIKATPKSTAKKIDTTPTRPITKDKHQGMHSAKRRNK